MTDEMKTKVNGIIKTLPIGYYIKKNVPVELKDCKASYYDFVSQTITISTQQLDKGLYKLDDDSRVENDIRCILYHEVSHAFASYMYGKGNYFAWSIPMNVFEDERIETLFAKKYMGVDFKEYVKRLNDYDIARMSTPTTADAFFFNIVRFRLGPKTFVDRVQKIIDKYATLSPSSCSDFAENYEWEVKLLYDDVKDYFKYNQDAVENSYNKFINKQKKEKEDKTEDGEKDNTESTEDEGEGTDSSDTESSDNTENKENEDVENNEEGEETTDKSSDTSDEDKDSEKTDGKSGDSESDKETEGEEDKEEDGKDDDSSDDIADKEEDDEDDEDDSEEDDDDESGNDGEGENNGDGEDTKEEDDKEDTEDTDKEDDDINKGEDDEDGDSMGDGDEDDEDDEDGFGEYDITDGFSADGASEVKDPYGDITDKLFKDSINKYTDRQIQQKFEVVINNINKASARNGSAINSYFGKFDPRSAGREDYKFFLKKNDMGDRKQFSKLHLNLFIDNSGSYARNDNVTNCMLACLSNIEKTNPNFTFQLVTINMKVVEHEKTNRTFKSFGGNLLPKSLYDIVNKYQYRDRYVMNIVMFDGDFVTDEYDREEAAKNCGAFNVPHTTIITDPYNEHWFKKYCPTTKIISTRNYASELIQHVLTAIQIGL